MLIFFSWTVMRTFYFHQQSCVDFIFHQQSIDYYQLVIILMWFLCNNVCHSDLQQVGDFFQGTGDSSTNKTGRIKLTVTKQEVYCFISTVIQAIQQPLQLISLKVYCLRNQSYRDNSANQKQYLNCWTFLHKVLEIRTRIIRVIVVV